MYRAYMERERIEFANERSRARLRCNERCGTCVCRNSLCSADAALTPNRFGNVVVVFLLLIFYYFCAPCAGRRTGRRRHSVGKFSAGARGIAGHFSRNARGIAGHFVGVTRGTHWSGGPVRRTSDRIFVRTFIVFGK